MNIGKRSGFSNLRVNLLREGIVESVHLCHAAVVNQRGRLLSAAGDPEAATFARSCLKPIQAIPVSVSGALERFRLGEQDLAVICGSHQGAIAQARQVFNILWRCDAEAEVLQCPIPDHGHSCLQHNCSGKHAGMIAVCQQHNWSLQGYLHRNHPIQQLILNTMAEMLHMPAAEFIGVHDDCGVPTYLLQVAQLAHLYAQLASSNQLHLVRIGRSMVNHPDMVSGVGQFDTELMQMTSGEIVSKSGAEGLQCIGKLNDGLGLAIKVMDGGKRAKQAAALHLLKQLSWISTTVADTLAEKFSLVGKYSRLEVVGDLSFL
ncbi:MAG: asparaginase [Pseudanabaenaceae cyanobacterium bins.68]|nr:asparaginase [Pseudanabaenaceae cyanobacterium bins.68]